MLCGSDVAGGMAPSEGCESFEGANACTGTGTSSRGGSGPETALKLTMLVTNARLRPCCIGVRPERNVSKHSPALGVVLFAIVLGVLSACIDDGIRNTPPDASPVPDAFVADARPLVPPVALVTELINPTALAVDDTHVYWLNGGQPGNENSWVGTAILRVPLRGGLEERIASPVRRPVSLAVNETHVFWIESELDDHGELWRVPKNGSEEPALVHPSAAYVSLGPDRVFFAGYRSIMSANKDGTDMQVLTRQDGEVTGTYFLGGELYWTEEGGWPVSSRVFRMATGSSAPPTTVFEQPGENFANLTGDENAVFWTSDNGVVAVTRMSLDTGLLGYAGQVDDVERPGGLGATGDAVYFSAHSQDGQGALYEASTDGGPATLLVSGSSAVAGPVMGPENLYWVERGAAPQSRGTLYMLAR